MGIIQKTIGGVKRMFGTKEITDNYKFVKNFSTEVISSELHSTASHKQPLALDETQIKQTSSTFKKLVTVYLSAAFLALLYCFYNLARHNHIVALLSVGFILLCLSFAFRYHFWLFQLKKRQLGCSFKEWLDDTLGRGA
ncbi:MAG: icmV [Gammaproteobacteria bacterium]|jgi:hypothetical protein|nr:icmV [Gammaproteobacteria bacterium]